MVIITQVFKRLEIIGLFGGLVSRFLSCLYILEISPLLDMGLVKIFSHFVESHFALLTVCFTEASQFQ